MGWFFRFLKQLKNVFIGIPVAVLATVVIGVFAGFAFIYAAAHDKFIRTAFGQKEVHTDQLAETLNKAFHGAIGWFWSKSTLIISENLQSAGKYANESRKLTNIDGVPGGSVFNIVGSVDERAQREERTAQKALGEAQKKHQEAEKKLSKSGKNAGSEYKIPLLIKGENTGLRSPDGSRLGSTKPRSKS